MQLATCEVDAPVRDDDGIAILAERYHKFMASPVVRGFVAHGGKVFVATEQRPFLVIRTLLAQGHRHFAEKYVREVLAKWPEPGALPADLVLHDYGRLQTNKAEASLLRFDAIESVDRPRLIARIAGLRDRGSRARTFHLQVNMGREPQKGGVAPEDVEALFAFATHTHGLDIAGLMAIPPRGDNPEPYFKWLRRMANRLGLPDCVMGMSDDYRVAIECGATAIRIGRAILGPKPSAPVLTG